MVQYKNKKKNQLEIKELTSIDRVFRIDRDTFLIYVGQTLSDKAPFIRIGCGENIPKQVLPHIQSVILTQNSNINIGKELEWWEASLQQGQKEVKYIGAQEKIKEFYKLARYTYTAKKNKKYTHGDNTPPPIKIEAFGPPAHVLSKGTVTVNQMDDDNIIIFIGSSRIFDYNLAKNKNIDFEKEYTLLTNTIDKLTCRLENDNHRSFTWLGTEKSINNKRPFLYWNLRSSGFLVNPTAEFHRTLFKENINPNRANNFISHSGVEAGLIDGINCKNMLKEPVAFFATGSEIINPFKKLYPEAKLSQCVDGSNIPFVPDTNFFASRAKTHGVLSWRFDSNEDAITQILFPIGGKRPRRAFDLIRSPHDVEIQVINKREDFKDSLAHIALQVPADYSQSLFKLHRLKAGSYPLVPHKEYILHQAKKPEEIIEELIANFQGIKEFEFLRYFLSLHFGSGLNLENLNKGLKLIRKIKIPFKHFELRHNLWNYLEFIKLSPAYNIVYSSKQKSIITFLCTKLSPLQISYKKWLELSEKPVEFNIFLVGGTKAFLFTKAISNKNYIAYAMPPSLKEISQQPRAYPRMLRLWERYSDRHKNASERQLFIDTLTKLYDNQLFLFSERNRFKSLSEGLGLNLDIINTDTTEKKLWQQKIDRYMKAIIPRYSGELSETLTRNLAHTLRFLPLSLLALLTLFGSIKGISYLSNGISNLGNSADEIYATTLVSSGKFQKSHDVPGENNIETSVKEISQYVKALARNNKGFLPTNLGQNNTQAQRDLDLVFPGEFLRLPDRRLARVKKGEHVWEIARIHYRKDFARIHILKKQIIALNDNDNNSPKELRKKISNKKKYIQRLAVTDKMLAFARGIKYIQ